MKIHISEDSKKLLDKVGGFRCDYRGTLELSVRIQLQSISVQLAINMNVFQTGEKMDTFWLIGPDNSLFYDNFP